jgi:hypothetical protein
MIVSRSSRLPRKEILLAFGDAVFYATLTEERIGRGIFVGYAASIEDSRRKLQFDLNFIKHMSFFLDVYIFVKTVKTIVFGRERGRAKPVKEERTPHPAADLTSS